MEFNNFLSTIKSIVTVSDILSAIAIIVSIFALIKSNKEQKETQCLEEEREKIRKELTLHGISLQENQNKIASYEILLQEQQNRVYLIPYFHLELKEDIYVKEEINKKYLILPITLINLGKESAINVQLIPMIQGGGWENYFETEFLSRNIHFVHDYLDKQYAVSKNKIKLSACCDFHENAHNVYFKIRYDDLVGRTYEQKFRFQYCYNISTKFSLNNTTFVPVCVDDTDKTRSKPY